MVVTGREREPAGPGRRLGEALLRSASQVLFSRSLLVGLLVLVATMAVPRIGLSGLLAVVVATATAWALGVHDDPVRDGLFGYNALLVGLGAGALLPFGGPWLALCLSGAVGVTLVTAALRSALATAALPVLTLPFLVVFPLLAGTVEWLGIPSETLLADPWASSPAGPVVGALQSLGALFFLPRVDVGLLVAVALLLHSRIGAVLAALGLLLAAAVSAAVPEVAQSGVGMTLGFNLALVAVALGGVWFVPGPASYLLGLVGAGLAALLTLGALPLATRLGMPLTVVPFNATVLLVLFATRQRVRDAAPKAVDFWIGSPEQNLRYWRTRVARFGAHYVARFRAPFLGRWTCTQGRDEQPTHQGIWSEAADFEVLGPDGRRHRGRGAHREDYLCWRLPVLACADGTVAKVVHGVADNAPGEVDTEENWGNVVVLYHGPGLYSLVAHLADGSITVHEGQVVKRGDELGRCGSSGRSPVPHLHWQLQGAVEPGSPTLHLELHDVVTERPEGPELHGTFTPARGDVVRNLQPSDELTRRLRWRPADRLAFEVEDGGETRIERLRGDLDLLGNATLRSEDTSALLVYARDGGVLAVLDALGPRRSVVHLLRAALCRVPLEDTDGLSWVDHLPARDFLPPVLRPLLDPLSPFLGAGGLAVRYRLRRDGDRFVVDGVSQRTDRTGTPLVRTRAVLDPAGVAEIEVTVRGWRRRAVRAHPTEDRRRDETPVAGTGPRRDPARLGR